MEFTNEELNIMILSLDGRMKALMKKNLPYSKVQELYSKVYTERFSRNKKGGSN